MKWTKNELDNLKFNLFESNETIDFSNVTFSKELNVNSIRDVKVKYKANYNSYLQSLTLDLTINGTMIIPCARTLELVNYPFETNETITYSFNDNDEDAIIVNGNIIDTYEFIYDCIITSIPLAVYKEGSKPIEETKETKEIDPRLAKLKELIK